MIPENRVTDKRNIISRWCNNTASKLVVILTVICSLLFLVVDDIVQALPDGAPVCIVGTFAPATWAHKTALGDLDNGKFVITIGGAVLLSNETLRVPSGVNLPFIVAGTDRRFKGVLAIVNNPNIPLLDALLPKTTDVKVQEECPPQGYSGFTHESNNLKWSVEGTLYLKTDVQAFVDVNVVVLNNAHQSIYYYSRYTISSYGIPPVPAPVPVPIPIPVPVPAPIPIPVPVPAPIPLPVPAPIPLPVSAPIPQPVQAPVPLPVPAPIPLPVPAPIPQPVQAPVPMTPPLPIPIAPPKTAPIPVPQSITAPVPVLPMPTSNTFPTSAPTIVSPSCGLFQLGIFCLNGCGIIRRLLNLCG